SRAGAYKIALALLEIYKTPQYNEEIFAILEAYINKGKQRTGRPGMDLWQIFVLAQYRLGLDLTYDELDYMVNEDKTLRSLLGIQANEFDVAQQEISYQNLIDNLNLINDEMIRKINTVIVSFAHGEVFKKKAAAGYALKTDSYVVESNVHFPTDYNLLWDCGRKCLDLVTHVLKSYPDIPGWRKLKDWRKRIKNSSRQIGQISAKGGPNKGERLKECTEIYVKTVTELANKLIDFLPLIPLDDDTLCWQHKIQLEEYIVLTIKHIDLLERRLLKGETIPHEEKMFSIFEQYTEWITKGKQHRRVELGKKLCLTTDQNNLIVDYRIMDHQADSQVVIDIAADLLSKYVINTWSFDKGFYHKDNKAILADEVGKVIMPKKGKQNKDEKEEERQPKYKKLRNKHSAIESNINELEHRGLNRCPDRGYGHFKRYVGIGVCAYNLYKIGAKLREVKIAEQIRLRKEARLRSAA
ncbi:MAG: ISNCY family transposase, partial [Saprospiraceae bacterium]